MSLPTDGTAVVTGASSGIGTEIARELSRRGLHVTLVARSADKLEALAAELGDAVAVPCDRADRDARAALPAAVAAHGRDVTVLVNNAGLSTIGPIASGDVAAETATVELDVLAVVDLTTRWVGAMVDRGRGAVLNVASTAAFQPLPGQAGYAASKSFVLSYTQSLAAELRGTGVSATALCPGPVQTGFGERAGFSDEDAHDALPDVMWLSAAAVARAAVDGLDRGRPVVIPGLANRVGARFAHLAPRRVLLPLLARNHPAMKP